MKDAIEEHDADVAARMAGDVRAYSTYLDGITLLASLVKVLDALPEGYRRDLADAVSHLAYLHRADLPEPSAPTQMRRDAKLWADMADPIELEAYVAAALHRLDRTPIAMDLQARLLTTFFKALPEDRRRAFLARVDPAGRFHRKSV